ncbi:hypothetical protein ACFL1Q_02775 [Patescibacteria group bacterium]
MRRKEILPLGDEKDIKDIIEKLALVEICGLRVEDMSEDNQVELLIYRKLMIDDEEFARDVKKKSKPITYNQRRKSTALYW